RTPRSCLPCLRLQIWCWLDEPSEALAPELRLERRKTRRDTSKIVSRRRAGAKILASLLVKPASTAQLRPREKYRLNQRFPCAINTVRKFTQKN
ncbi:hypothetical protein, partial [Massilia niastensis]|uniref:hypothetical protein n=1 Tax=Massilia niastensis TaxID=544911 RepID=UPI001B7FD628